MDSRTPIALAVVGAVVVAGIWYLIRAILMWQQRHGGGVIRAEGGRPVAHVDTAFALSTDAEAQSDGLDGPARLSERGVRDQHSATKGAPAAESAASAVVIDWARGRRCVSCGGELVEGRMAGHHIALLGPDGTTREWIDVAADRLPLALATSLPVCWSCHVAATFRRMYPQLVVDREAKTVHVKRTQN